MALINREFSQEFNIIFLFLIQAFLAVITVVTIGGWAFYNRGVVDKTGHCAIPPRENDETRGKYRKNIDTEPVTNDSPHRAGSVTSRKRKAQLYEDDDIAKKKSRDAQRLLSPDEHLGRHSMSPTKRKDALFPKALKSEVTECAAHPHVLSGLRQARMVAGVTSAAPALVHSEYDVLTQHPEAHAAGTNVPFGADESSSGDVTDKVHHNIEHITALGNSFTEMFSESYTSESTAYADEVQNLRTSPLIGTLDITKSSYRRGARASPAYVQVEKQESACKNCLGKDIMMHKLFETHKLHSSNDYVKHIGSDLPTAANNSSPAEKLGVAEKPQKPRRPGHDSVTSITLQLLNTHDREAEWDNALLEFCSQQRAKVSMDQCSGGLTNFLITRAPEQESSFSTLFRDIQKMQELWGPLLQHYIEAYLLLDILPAEMITSFTLIYWVIATFCHVLHEGEEASLQGVCQAIRLDKKTLKMVAMCFFSTIPRLELRINASSMSRALSALTHVVIRRSARIRQIEVDEKSKADDSLSQKKKRQKDNDLGTCWAPYDLKSLIVQPEVYITEEAAIGPTSQHRQHDVKARTANEGTLKGDILKQGLVKLEDTLLEGTRKSKRLMEVHKVKDPKSGVKSEAQPTSSFFGLPRVKQEQRER